MKPYYNEEIECSNAIKKYMAHLIKEGYCISTSDLSRFISKTVVKSLMEYSKEVKTPLYCSSNTITIPIADNGIDGVHNYDR